MHIRICGYQDASSRQIPAAGPLLAGSQSRASRDRYQDNSGQAPSAHPGRTGKPVQTRTVRAWSEPYSHAGFSPETRSRPIPTVRIQKPERTGALRQNLGRMRYRSCLWHLQGGKGSFPGLSVPRP